LKLSIQLGGEYVNVQYIEEMGEPQYLVVMRAASSRVMKTEDLAPQTAGKTGRNNDCNEER